MDHTELLQLVMYRNPINYASLKVSVVSVVSAKDAFLLNLAATHFLRRRFFGALT